MGRRGVSLQLFVAGLTIGVLHCAQPLSLHALPAKRSGASAQPAFVEIEPPNASSLAYAAAGAAVGALAAAAAAKKGSKKGSFKVCVCGGAGGIGQPLSMLMAQNPHVRELCVFDLTLAMVPAQGVATDLSHIEAKSKLKGYALDKDDKPIDKLGECLSGCDLVLVPAGMPRKPGMTRADLLGVNAGIAKNIVEACAKFCPNAVVGLIVNPVNSVVPAMCELYKKKGLDPRKICGVTSLDIVRANKFVHELTGAPVETIDVPVIGGHAGTTILPLFSQVPAAKSIPANQIPALDKHVQDAGTDVVNAKVTFGLGGVKKAHPIGALNEYEQGRLKECVAQLKGEIDAGLEYAKTVQLA